MRTFLQILLQALSAFSCIITIWLFFVIRIKKEDLAYSSKFIVHVNTSKYKTRYVVIAFIVTAIFVSLSILLPDKPIPPDPTPPPPTFTPSPTPSTNIDPTLPPQAEQLAIPLSSLTPIITDKNAFFFDSWSSYSPLIVDDNSVESGFGIAIPYEDQVKYFKEHAYENVPHKEILEYKLCRKYQLIKFTYGIDNSSYYDFDEDTPSCRCRILVQYKTADQPLGETDNILFDSGEFYYDLSRTDKIIDVSQVYTLRFTFLWSYTPDPTKQNCFNLAIIDPVLTLKKA